MVFLGVNVPWDTENLARLFIQVYKVPYPVGRDVSGEIAKLYGVEATPITLFVGKDGKLVEQITGGMEEPDIAKHIAAILK